jgi:hypothetical protein
MSRLTSKNRIEADFFFPLFGLSCFRQKERPRLLYPSPSKTKIKGRVKSNKNIWRQKFLQDLRKRKKCLFSFSLFFVKLHKGTCVHNWPSYFSTTLKKRPYFQGDGKGSSGVKPPVR